MADLLGHAPDRSTTHRERITYVIERRLSRKQSASCDLNQVLTLRGSARSAYETAAVVPSVNRHKV
jgi:hypothetical protein